MESAQKILNETTKALESIYDFREAKNVSKILLCDLLQIDPADVMLGKHVEVDNSILNEALKRLLSGEPIQYIIGETEFYGLRFKVNQNVLIPRPETEELVKVIIDSNEIGNPKILDIGTGSGIIAITLNKFLGGTVYAMDISDQAIQVAKENSRINESSVQFICTNVLEDQVELNDLDILVSNPPYIPNIEYNQLDHLVRDHEPKVALHVSDDDPMIFYRRIGEIGKESLKPKGKIYFEINEKYANETEEILNQLRYIDVNTYQDMQGKDRIVVATNSANKWL